MVTWITDGDSLLSIAMSLSDKCASGSNTSCEGTVNSQHLKNPKRLGNMLPRAGCCHYPVACIGELALFCALSLLL